MPALRTSGFYLLLALSVGVSAYAIGAYSLFPVGASVHPNLRANFEVHRVGIFAHVFASAVALLLGPFQFLSVLRAKRPALHRWLGRTYLAIGVVVGGMAGLFMAFHAYGGLIARVGFAGLALAWLYTGGRAYRAIRARDVVSHRRWMVRNFALTFAAVTLRLWLPASVAAGIAFEFAYPVVAWLCWVPNLVVAELLFNQAQRAPGARLR